MTEESAILIRNRTRLMDRVNGITCVRFLVFCEVLFQIIKISISGIVLFITKHQKTDEPLSAFIGGYIFLCAAKGCVFLAKNRAFFYINSFSEFEDSNTDISVANNLIEGCNLFWYIIGFHWLQQCANCKEQSPLLYYTCYSWLILGFITFIGPLAAIVLLLILVNYIKPALKTVIFHSEEDLPDGNTRCVICYENYCDGCSVKFLPCDHHFHTECIDEWFNVRDSCPLCKKSINMLVDVIESNESII